MRLSKTLSKNGDLGFVVQNFKEKCFFEHGVVNGVQTAVI